MRRWLPVFLGPLIVLLTACSESGPAEPIARPIELPIASPIPTATLFPTATSPPQATGPSTLASPGARTELPERTEPADVTESPTATSTAKAIQPPPTESPSPAPTLPTLAPTLPTLAPMLPSPAPTLPSPAPTLPTTAPTPDPSLPLVTIGQTTWAVELATTPAQRAQGLSGREGLLEGTGMLFIFETDRRLTFWMPEMNFPLDMVWIDSGCLVVDATLNAPVPLPGQSRADLPRFSPRQPARFVLEVNAGEFEGSEITLGAHAVFEGALEGQYGC